MQLERVRDPVELAIVAGIVRGKARRMPYTCSECKAPCPTIHVVPVHAAPRILKLCAGCYNAFVDLVSSCKPRDWVPTDTMCRGESILGYAIKRLRAWLDAKGSNREVSA